MIVHALALRGYELSLTEAEYYWSKYSASLLRSWVFVPGDADDIYAAIAPYLNPHCGVGVEFPE
jgi:hypothetical protein